MSKLSLRGTYTALITPFQPDGSLDEAALRSLVRRQIEAGVEGVVPCGTTGEAVTLDAAEQQRVVALVVEEARGKVQVVAGTGSNDTKKTIAATRAAAEAGADAALVVTPYYNKPPQAGLVAHYRAVADVSPVPLVLYNVPGRTGVNLLPETALRLAEHGNIAGVKEASGSLDQATEILRGRPEGFALLSGEDTLALPMVALGGDGVIAVISNEAPAAYGQMIRAALEGDLATARRIHRELYPLMRANFVESNPVPVKYAMAKLGLCHATVRLPLSDLSEESRPKVDDALSRAGLLG